MTDWDHDGIPDLTSNTPNGYVEVHIASGSSKYQTRVQEVPTTFVTENDGTWLMTDWDGDGTPDLVFIKTSNTPNGYVEVHIASGSSKYQTRVQEVPTTFVTENDGTWLMTDWDGDGTPDLVFIKTSNTPNGYVEVHIASGSSKYQTRVVEVPTTFVNEDDGTWLMTDWDHDGIPDLVFIKTSNTPNGHVEVHVAAGGK
ncbi:MAG: putative FG-GAP repeat protein [Linnemannia elongata]|nr:MAG: putative FG-GAP repeat protein [Linnemannia elongata]